MQDGDWRRRCPGSPPTTVRLQVGDDGACSRRMTTPAAVSHGISPNSQNAVRFSCSHVAAVDGAEPSRRPRELIG